MGFFKENKKGNAVVLMSGGIDSAACSHFFKTRGLEVSGLFIDYGQAAAKYEEHAADKFAQILKINLHHQTVKGAHSFEDGELVGRNAFLITSAIFLSKIHEGILAIGIHTGTNYYDCSPAFFNTMSKLVAEHTDSALVLSAPFLNWTKGDVANYFSSTGLPVNVAYSCERGMAVPCGRCKSCIDRRTLNVG